MAKEEEKIISETPEPSNDNEDGVELKKIALPAVINVGDLAKLLEVPVTDLIKELLKAGISATLNQEISFDEAALVALSFGYEAEKEKGKVEEIVTTKDLLSKEKPENLEVRPPIVTVMGHVDHGKTSLLDAIRKSSVVKGEAGGITQHIGAYQVAVPAGRQEKKGPTSPATKPELRGVNKKITFLDTPGHEAFVAMRARGAQVTDIVVLVVAADDGIRPQTIEAINHSKKSKVPMLVAITKIDKEGANLEKVKAELQEKGLTPEDWGGDTIVVPVSAVTGEGIDDLLEMILLLAEIRDLKASKSGKFFGTVIESHLDKGKGPLSSVLIQNGTLKVGSFLACGAVFGKVRFMAGEDGKMVVKASPGTPVQVGGLTDVAEAGDICQGCETEKEAKELAKIKAAVLRAKTQAPTVIFRSQEEEQENGSSERVGPKKLKLIIKADVQGSLEALVSSLELLSTDEVGVAIIQGSVGPISEGDVLLAQTTGATLIGFHVKQASSIEKLAGQKKVRIKNFRVIYEIVDFIHQQLEGMLEPEIKEVLVGKLEILEIFREGKRDWIVGGKVKDGKLEKGLEVKVLRNDKYIGPGKILNLKIGKDNVGAAEKGQECGIDFQPGIIEKEEEAKEREYVKAEKGDVFEAYKKEEVKRKL